MHSCPVFLPPLPKSERKRERESNPPYTKHHFLFFPPLVGAPDDCCTAMPPFSGLLPLPSILCLTLSFDVSDDKVEISHLNTLLLHSSVATELRDVLTAPGVIWFIYF